MKAGSNWSVLTVMASVAFFVSLQPSPMMETLREVSGLEMFPMMANDVFDQESEPPSISFVSSTLSLI